MGFYRGQQATALFNIWVRDSRFVCVTEQHALPKYAHSCCSWFVVFLVLVLTATEGTQSDHEENRLGILVQRFSRTVQASTTWQTLGHATGG